MAQSLKTADLMLFNEHAQESNNHALYMQHKCKLSVMPIKDTYNITKIEREKWKRDLKRRLQH